MKAIIALSISLTKHDAGDETGSFKPFEVSDGSKLVYLALKDW